VNGLVSRFRVTSFDVEKRKILRILSVFS